MFRKSLVKFGFLFSVICLNGIISTVQADVSDLSKLSSNSSNTLKNAIVLLQSKDVQQSKKGFHLLQKLDNHGNSNAQMWLGKIYRDGLGGVAKDYGLSFQYFQKAAGRKGRNPEAQYELAHAYKEGIGTDLNLISAYIWTKMSLSHAGYWKKAANQQIKDIEKQLTTSQIKKVKELIPKIKVMYFGESSK